jgi:hypothetical protein
VQVVAGLPIMPSIKEKKVAFLLERGAAVALDQFNRTVLKQGGAFCLVDDYGRVTWYTNKTLEEMRVIRNDARVEIEL